MAVAATAAYLSWSPEIRIWRDCEQGVCPWKNTLRATHPAWLQVSWLRSNSSATRPDHSIGYHCPDIIEFSRNGEAPMKCKHCPDITEYFRKGKSPMKCQTP